MINKKENINEIEPFLTTLIFSNTITFFIGWSVGKIVSTLMMKNENSCYKKIKMMGNLKPKQKEYYLNLCKLDENEKTIKIIEGEKQKILLSLKDKEMNEKINKKIEFTLIELKKESDRINKNISKYRIHISESFYLGFLLSSSYYNNLFEECRNKYEKIKIKNLRLYLTHKCKYEKVKKTRNQIENMIKKEKDERKKIRLNRLLKIMKKLEVNEQLKVKKYYELYKIDIS